MLQMPRDGPFRVNPCNLLMNQNGDGAPPPCQSDHTNENRRCPHTMQNVFGCRALIQKSDVRCHQSQQMQESFGERTLYSTVHGTAEVTDSRRVTPFDPFMAPLASFGFFFTSCVRGWGLLGWETERERERERQKERDRRGAREAARESARARERERGREREGARTREASGMAPLASFRFFFSSYIRVGSVLDGGRETSILRESARAREREGE